MHSGQFILEKYGKTETGQPEPLAGNILYQCDIGIVKFLAGEIGVTALSVNNCLAKISVINRCLQNAPAFVHPGRPVAFDALNLWR